MGELTHKAARAAFGGAIDLAMRKMDKDREKGLLDLVDLTERFMGDNFQKSSYEGARKMIQDPDSKWMSYVNRALDEIDPHETLGQINKIKQTFFSVFIHFSHCQINCSAKCCP